MADVNDLFNDLDIHESCFDEELFEVSSVYKTITRFHNVIYLFQILKLANTQLWEYAQIRAVFWQVLVPHGKRSFRELCPPNSRLKNTESFSNVCWPLLFFNSNHHESTFTQEL